MAIDAETRNTSLRQSQIFLASRKLLQKSRHGEQQKTGAARLLEQKQKMLELQERLDEEKPAFLKRAICWLANS